MQSQLVSAVEHLPDDAHSIRSTVYARIGLLGNPSDGYNGKVLAVSLANFSAVVTLSPATTISFELSPEGDPTQFTSLDAFQAHILGHGYYGGVRLLMAMTHQLLSYCHRNTIPLLAPSHHHHDRYHDGDGEEEQDKKEEKKGFSLSYRTNIPRQRGMSGSSAIACAALNCLLSFYCIEHAVPVADRPSLILAAESSLGITAGLQDRIIQVYGGVVYMDFSTNLNINTQEQQQQQPREEKHHPRCVSLDSTAVEWLQRLPLYLIYSSAPSGKDSGTVHSNFKERWREGTAQMREQMQEVAHLAAQGFDIILENSRKSINGEYNIKSALERQALAPLVRRNFELRKSMFGANCLDSSSLKMIEVAASAGFAAKFTGSGGAVVALSEHQEESNETRLVEACNAAGFICERVNIGPTHHIAVA